MNITLSDVLNALAVLLYVLAYALIAKAAFKNYVLRIKAYSPNVSVSRSDVATMSFMALLWPIAWPISYSAYPSLKSYTRDKTTASSGRVDTWATKELARRNISKGDL